ncbi:MAG TPA: hypothetical protein VGR35_00550 [Tepidisphaeraceae bacterium]|nr:hypothetical protein [Tepidisphaeraceae bacterium]
MTDSNNASIIRLRAGEHRLVALEGAKGALRVFRITTSEKKFSAQMGAADSEQVEDVKRKLGKK